MKTARKEEIKIEGTEVTRLVKSQSYVKTKMGSKMEDGNYSMSGRSDFLTSSGRGDSALSTEVFISRKTETSNIRNQPDRREESISDQSTNIGASTMAGWVNWSFEVSMQCESQHRSTTQGDHQSNAVNRIPVRGTCNVYRNAPPGVATTHRDP